MKTKKAVIIALDIAVLVCIAASMITYHFAVEQYKPAEFKGTYNLTNEECIAIIPEHAEKTYTHYYTDGTVISEGTYEVTQDYLVMYTADKKLYKTLFNANGNYYMTNSEGEPQKVTKTSDEAVIAGKQE